MTRKRGPSPGPVSSSSHSPVCAHACMPTHCLFPKCKVRFYVSTRDQSESSTHTLHVVPKAWFAVGFRTMMKIYEAEKGGREGGRAIVEILSSRPVPYGQRSWQEQSHLEPGSRESWERPSRANCQGAHENSHLRTIPRIQGPLTGLHHLLIVLPGRPNL